MMKMLETPVRTAALDAPRVVDRSKIPRTITLRRLVYKVPNQESQANAAGIRGRQLRTPTVKKVVETNSDGERNDETAGDLVFRRTVRRRVRAAGTNPK